MSEEILKTIKETVEDAVDKKINGKLIGIKEHLGRQDTTLSEVKTLLEERKFIMQMWAFFKFLGGVAVSVGGALLLYNNINK